jgi:hypothetical protein
MASKSSLPSLFTATRFHIVAQGRGLPRTLGSQGQESFTLKALYRIRGPDDLCNAFSVISFVVQPSQGALLCSDPGLRYSTALR